jgi:hypothetical protein
MVSRQILTLVRNQTLSDKKAPEFQVVVRKRPNPHKLSLTLDWGDAPGAWLSVGVNDTLWGLGFLPKNKTKNKKQEPVLATSATTSV